MTKLTLRRIFAKRKPDKVIDGFQYFEVPLGEEGIVLYVNDQSFLTDPLYGFSQFAGVLEANKEDIPHPEDVKNALVNVKWSYIDYERIGDIKNLPKGVFNDQWGAWENEGGSFTVAEYGIQKQYAQAKMIKAAFKDKAQLGKMFWIEAYKYYPEFNNPKLGAFVAVIGDSQVLSTNFSVNKNDPLEQGVYRYEDLISLTIKTHLLPNVNTPFHDFAIFEIDIYEFNSDIKMNENPIRHVQKHTDKQNAYNTNNVIDIKIEKKWRDKAKHDKNQHTKYFYAKIKILHYKNEDAQLGDKAVPINGGLLSSHSIGSKVLATAPNGEQVVVEISKKDWDDNRHFFGVSHSGLEKSANTYTKTVVAEYSTKEEGKGRFYFGVYYNTTSELLNQRKFEVQKMIAEVLKNKYTVKNNEPCKFSSIQVEVEGRKPVIVFDEKKITAKQADNAINLFEIVAGDSQKKKITITLDGLEAQHYQTESKTKPRCDAVGLPSGQKHDEKSVIDTRSFPAQRIDQEDYTIKDNSIELKLGYVYDKTVAEGTAINNALLDKLWLFNYFWLSNKLAQPYAIPLSTCRYPNQIVKLMVYPDIEWEVAFIITTGETHTLSVGVPSDLTDYPAKKGLKLKDKFSLSSKYKGFGFDAQIKIKENGNTHSFTLEKIQNMIKRLADLKEFLDKFDSSKSTIATKSGFSEYYNFTLKSPNIALAFRWYFDNLEDEDKKNQVVTMLNGAIRLAPLIGITFEVDLFIITDNIKVYCIGKITELIRKSIEWVTETDIYIEVFVGVELLGEFNIVYNSFNGIDKKKSKNKATLNIPFGVKGGIKSDEDNVIVLPSGEKLDKFKGEISANSGVKIIEELGSDDQGPYKKTNYKFSGLTVKIIIVENMFVRSKMVISPKIDKTFTVLEENNICPDVTEYLKND